MDLESDTPGPDAKAATEPGMAPEIARVLAEARIVESRPIGVGLATVGLVMIALDLVLMAPMFLLVGLFVGPSLMTIGLAMLAGAAVCAAIGVCLYPGHLWAWWAANIVCVPLLAVLVGWMCTLPLQAGWATNLRVTYHGVLLVMLGLLLVAVVILLWSPAVRKWFFRMHRIRRGSFERVTQELLIRDIIRGGLPAKNRAIEDDF